MPPCPPDPAQYRQHDVGQHRTDRPVSVRPATRETAARELIHVWCCHSAYELSTTFDASLKLGTHSSWRQIPSSSESHELLRQNSPTLASQKPPQVVRRYSEL